MRIHTQLKVFKNRLFSNLDSITDSAADKKLIVMVKSEAYGHGLIAMSSLFQEYGEKIDYLGVASLAEAIYLRKQDPSNTIKILVFSELGLENDYLDYYCDYGIDPLISSLDDLNFFCEQREFKKHPLFLKFNTGMNRLGIDIDQTDKVIEILKKHSRFEIEHLMTHTACSYLKKNKHNRLQLSEFEMLIKNLRASNIKINEISYANSGCIENNFLDLESSHVRPGLTVYGAQSSFTSSQNLKSKIISNLETKILEVRAIKKGEVFGYGATVAKENGYLLILPLGYGDGFPTKMCGYKLNIEGIDFEVAGRVNMDLTYLFTQNEKAHCFKNKMICLWGEKPSSVNSIAKHLGNHPYEVFCSLSSRVPRKYLLE